MLIQHDYERTAPARLESNLQEAGSAVHTLDKAQRSNSYPLYSFREVFRGSARLLSRFVYRSGSVKKVSAPAAGFKIGLP